MHHTREIPREGWGDYLSRVAASEREHMVRIEAGSTDIGEQPLAGRLPLLHIALETKGSDMGAIEVTVGRPGEEITHRILTPERIYADEGDDGALGCLDIEDQEHVKTLIYFEPESLGTEELRA